MPLADTQARMRRAVVGGESGDVLPLLVGGPDPRARLAIHQRHYEASLVTALLGRFPATNWLVGSAPLVEPARAFVRRHPPAAPCIAEYGLGFADWLGSTPLAERMPYLAAFGAFDWHLGRVAVEVEQAPLAFGALATLPPERLADFRPVLQSGLHYLQADWPVDELMRLFVTDTAPDRLVLSPEPVRLEIRGATGEFRFTRLSESDFVFRQALHRGGTLGEAAVLALEGADGFDPGAALAGLFTAGLVTDVAAPATTGDSR